MKHLIDLEHIAKTIDNKEAVLDILYEHACELRLTTLIEAIELYWESQTDQLSPEEYNGAQERSIKEQFSNDRNI